MKRFYWSALLIILLATCGNTARAAASSASATMVEANAPASNVVSASAVVVPATRSQMSFLISAPVKEVKVKEGDQIKPGQPLIVLDAPVLSFSVVEAQAALQAAQSDAALQRFRRKEFINGKFVYLSGPPEKIQMADAKAEQAQAALDAAQAALAQATLVAPYDGTIVSVSITQGELVQPGQVVLVVADLRHLQVETTDLSEREIANVQVGQTATIRLKAFGQDLSGTVTAIAPMGVKSGGDVVYKVTVELKNPPEGLMWGMSGDVEIQTR